MIRRGFTLVELMATVSILGLLAGLLFPAVQAAREAARKSQCQSNLHQVSIDLQVQLAYRDVIGDVGDSHQDIIHCPTFCEQFWRQEYRQYYDGEPHLKVMEDTGLSSTEIVVASDVINCHSGMSACLYLDGHVGMAALKD
jgi:prepilin-type N-terminal cleavage/methylation domain-containing protein/prepilin-type processing-associated H-X9-DG protein